MKHLLLSFSLLIGTAMAQTCPSNPCDNYTSIGFGTTQAFSGNQCLKGPGVIDSSSFSDFSFISISTLTIVQSQINCTGGSKRLYLDNVDVEDIVLDGNDTIYILTQPGGGITAIKNATLTGNTILYMPAGMAVWIAGSYYVPGSVYTNGGTITIKACGGGALALRPVVKPVFVPSITYHFIIYPFYGGREIRKTCTYKALLQWLPSNQSFVIEAGGLRQVTSKKY